MDASCAHRVQDQRSRDGANLPCWTINHLQFILRTAQFIRREKVQIMHGHHGRDIYYFHNQLAFADGPDGFEIRQGFVAWQGAAKLILCQL